jgi:hypothetical protein
MNERLILTISQKISLKEHPHFDEQWLRKVIEGDPSIIGLGDLELKEAERIQPKAGRLDLLLYDREKEKRYEVEIMLGKIDESHIIRAIEYWDNERKRLPNYEHCAVVIAEDVIAIQLNALAVEDKLILNFVKVLDEVSVGEDEDEISVKKDRTFWENKASKESLVIVDECNDILKEIDSDLHISYNQSYMGLFKKNRPFNFLVFVAKQKFVRVEIKVEDIETWIKKLEDHEFEIVSVGKGSGRIKFRIAKSDVANNHDLLKELFQTSYNEWIK